MKNIILIVSLVLNIFTTNAQQPNFEWAKQFGGTEMFDRGNSIVSDGNGNTYTIGNFSDTVDFDPSQATFNLSSNASTTFITKLDANGNFIWAKYLEIPNNYGYSGGNDIAIDHIGNLYITGYFDGNIDADPGVDNFNLSAGSLSVYIIKLDANGSFVWGNSLDCSTNGNGAAGIAISVDSMGYTYVTGQFTGSLFYGAGTLSTSDMQEEAFVAKLDTNGTPLWAIQKGNTSDLDFGKDIAPDSLGNVYITGRALGGIFITKLDVNGNTVWDKYVNGGSACSGNAILIGKSGNVYVTGFFTNSTDFDPGPGVFTLANIGVNDCFLLKLDSFGDFVWVKQYGETSYDRGKALVKDHLGDIYLAGYFDGVVDFDKGSDTFNLNSSNGNSFITKIDTGGVFKWALNYEGHRTISTEIGQALHVDASDDVYATGYFTGTADFNPEPSTFNLVASGTYDAYILKLNQNSTTDISEAGTKPNIKLYPNPTIGKVSISHSSIIKSIRVIDPTGRIIIDETTEKKETTINLKNFSKGVYTIEIDTNDDVIRRKVMKQ